MSKMLQFVDVGTQSNLVRAVHDLRKELYTLPQDKKAEFKKAYDQIHAASAGAGLYGYAALTLAFHDISLEMAEELQ